MSVKPTIWRRSADMAVRRTERGRSGVPAERGQAFTLIEMLVVIAVIGIVAAISVPAIKNMQKGDAAAAATRQMADEISNARLRAISQRSDVYLVFIPPAQNDYFTSMTAPTAQELRQATNLLAFQFTGYGFYSERSVGDQPGQSHPRYLGEWRQLPEGTFVASYKFGGTPVPGIDQFAYRRFPFPLSTSLTTRDLPYIGFDYQGRMFHEDATGAKVYGQDEYIPLARGAVGRPSGVGTLTASAQENPPNNSVNNYNHIRVTWLTGRASIERQ
jgi:prepilin-type N-terminal cleavage/methylation domain-containing protein